MRRRTMLMALVGYAWCLFVSLADLRAADWPHWLGPNGNGPRSTPTIEANTVYAQSVTGPLVCLVASSGKPIWSVDILKEFGGKNLQWGLSASPLVDGNLVYALPGAPGAATVAFNKQTG